ncbi:MAG: hypothetical protein WCK67_07815 [bacterium]
MSIQGVSGGNNFISGIKQNLKAQVAKLPITIETPDGFVDSFIKSTGGMEGWHQRGVLGLAAIATQPFIDLNNKNVDEETRKYSAIKTGVKILIGTGMGVLTRYLFGTALTKWPSFIAQSEKAFIKIPKEFNMDQAEDFKKGVSTFVGCIGTVISTFLIDKPLTNPVINASLKFFNVAEKPKQGAKK